MTKEKIKLANIKKDLSKVSTEKRSIKKNWYASYIAPITIMAIGVGFLLQNVWIGLAIFSLSSYHIYRYIVGTRDYIREKKTLCEAIDRGDISISVETLSHIADEVIYEPHTTTRSQRNHKVIKVFYFNSRSWRVPRTVHYEWSKEFPMSTRGLENTSVNGNEFFFVSLQGYQDLSYIYPCKFFELDESLKIQSNL